jgi:hypothetical protein
MSFQIIRSSHPWELLLRARTQSEIDAQVNEILSVMSTPLNDLCIHNQLFILKCASIYERLFPILSQHFSIEISIDLMTPNMIHVQRICIKTPQTELCANIISLAVAIVKSAFAMRPPRIIQIERAIERTIEIEREIERESALSTFLLIPINRSVRRLEKINRWVEQHQFPLQIEEDKEKLKKYFDKLEAITSIIDILRENASPVVLTALALDRLEAANELFSKFKTEMERLGFTL